LDFIETNISEEIDIEQLVTVAVNKTVKYITTAHPREPTWNWGCLHQNKNNISSLPGRR